MVGRSAVSRKSPALPISLKLSLMKPPPKYTSAEGWGSVLEHKAGGLA